MLAVCAPCTSVPSTVDRLRCEDIKRSRTTKKAKTLPGNFEACQAQDKRPVHTTRHHALTDQQRTRASFFLSFCAESLSTLFSPLRTTPPVLFRRTIQARNPGHTPDHIVHRIISSNVNECLDWTCPSPNV
jgi:hypothetical protein